MRPNQISQGGGATGMCPLHPEKGQMCGHAHPRGSTSAPDGQPEAIDVVLENGEFCTIDINYDPRPGRIGPLTDTEMRMAKTAWKYFENNYQPTTGLVNAVDGYPSVTLWDTGSYMAALFAARKLCLIDGQEFDTRVSKLLKTLRDLDLFRGEVPNKAYNTITGQKVDYGNQPGEIGYSALDLGRLMIWLDIYKNEYPQYSNAADSIPMRWNFCNMIDTRGSMFGAYVEEDGSTQYVQEGRLGYEEYGAKGFELWGFDTYLSSIPEPYDVIPMFGVDVPYDTRDPRRFGAHNYVVSESYVLDGIENNWDLPCDDWSPDDVHTTEWMAHFAQCIYAVQEARYKHTGILTARTEHQLDQPPYFVYDTIYTDGYPWNTITDTGEYRPEFAAIAAKGALGLWVLWDSPYTDDLFDRIKVLNDPEKGFYEGVYENGNGRINTFTANNNGIILETLLYKIRGKIRRPPDADTPPSHWERVAFSPLDDAAAKCRIRDCGERCPKKACRVHVPKGPEVNCVADEPPPPARCPENCPVP